MSTHAIELASESNTAAGTVYYPDSNGASTNKEMFFALGITAEDCEVSVEVSMDRTNWINCTGNLEDVEDGLWGGWIGDSYVFAAGAAETHVWQGWFIMAEWVRLKVIYPNATNSLDANLNSRGL
jgi:hypothetical protein